MNSEQLEFLEKCRQEERQRIMAMELLSYGANKKLNEKRAHLETIPKRMEDKKYPSANDGRKDQKDTERTIRDLESDIKRYTEEIATAKENIAFADEYETHLGTEHAKDKANR